MTAITAPNIGDALRRRRERRARALVPFVLGAAGVLGLGAGKLAAADHPTLILGLAAIPILMAIWRWPHSGVLMVLAMATTIEQFTYYAGSHQGVFTSRIPLFASATKGAGISLAEMLIGLVVAVWIMKGAVRHDWNTPRSPVAKTLIVYMGLVVLAVGVGMSRGGKMQVILYEVRPWTYLAVAYLLTASLLRSRSAIRAILWTIVIGTGFKAVQGLFMSLQVRHEPIPVELILSHEESFFFGIFLLLTLGLWTFGVKGRMRAVATTLAPIVLYADMANARRTAWAILGTTLVMFFALAYSALPARRRALRRKAVVVLALSALYFPVFWNSAGTLGQPARALHAQFSPDPRDLSSNLYRVQEDANLAYNIRQTAGLGKGFGPLIDYALPITDISKIDAFITFLPHNSVLDLWMRLGTQGMVVFLMLLAAAVFRASALTRSGDQDYAVLGLVAVCAVVAYVVQGSSDMGFFWFRIALCLGTLLGTVEAAHRLLPRGDRDEPAAAVAPTVAEGDPEPVPMG